MSSAFEIGCQIRLHDIPCHFVADKPSGQGQNIRIIMLARQLSELNIPAKGSPHMRMMVCRHLGAVATAAKNNSKRIFSILNILRQRQNRGQLYAQKG